MDDNGERQSAPAEQEAVVDSLGQTLANARTAKGLSIEEVAAELRIEAKQLLALERDRLDEIGVPVFIKGYLRQYGHRLGLDYNELLVLYYRQVDTQEIEIQPSRPIRLRDERQITWWVLAALVLAVLAVFLAVWWLNDPGFRRATSALEGAPAAPEQPAASAAARAKPSPSPERGTEPAADARGRTAPAAAEPPTAPPAAEPPAPPPAAAPPAAASPAAPSAAAPAAAGEGAPAGAPAPAPAVAAGGVASAPADGSGVELDVAFDQDSWAEITDARGTRLFYGLGHAGRSLELRGEPPFSTLLGNAAGVRLTVAGKPYAVPGAGQESKRVQFSIPVPEE
jgi:cytoskeleton protein RodZ